MIIQEIGGIEMIRVLKLGGILVCRHKQGNHKRALEDTQCYPQTGTTSPRPLTQGLVGAGQMLSHSYTPAPKVIGRAWEGGPLGTQ